MSLRLAIAQKLKTFAVFVLLTSFSLFLLWEILSSASSGCIGDVLSPESCRPDPLMKTYDLSGREQLSFWDVYSGTHDGEVVLTCGFVTDRTTFQSTNPDEQRQYATMHLDRPIKTGRHCFLAKVSRYSGPVTDKPVALPSYAVRSAGPRLLEVREVLPPY
jgi:hypothetical protein